MNYFSIIYLDVVIIYYKKGCKELQKNLDYDFFVKVTSLINGVGDSYLFWYTYASKCCVGKNMIKIP